MTCNLNKPLLNQPCTWLQGCIAAQRMHAMYTDLLRTFSSLVHAKASLHRRERSCHGMWVPATSA